MDEPLAPDIAAAVRARLGLETVHADGDGLRQLYRAWCDNIPFDNLRKLAGLARGTRPLPGDDANEFFTAWLEHGTGATCWASSNALFHLLAHCGFTVARITAAMLDLPEPNHASNVVHVDGDDFLVDSSILSGEPLVIDEEPSRTAGGSYTVELRPDGGTWVVTFPRSGDTERMVCRLFGGVATADAYAERHERTRRSSVFNHQLHVNRHRDGGVWRLNGDELTGWTAAGTSITRLADAERIEWLRRMGYSDAVIDDALAAEGTPPAA